MDRNIYTKLREPITVVLLSITVIAFVFYPAVFGHQYIFQYNYVGLDALDLNTPRRFLAVQSLIKYGEIPCWEPSIGCGVPLFAESEAGVLHPSLLFFFLNDLTLAHNLTILSAFLIAVLGSYAWGRCLGLSPLASGIGAAAFGFNKLFLLRTSGLNMLQVLAWLPGSLALIYMLAYDAKKRYWFGLVAVWLLQLLAGHMQMFVICHIACWAYIVFLTAESCFHDKMKMPLRYFLAAAVLALLFAAGLGAVQLLATHELVQKSVRSGVVPSMLLEQYNEVSPTWKMLTVFINPFYRCKPLLPNTPEGFQYFGLLPFLLCFNVINKQRLKTSVCLWLLAMFFMLTAMGPRCGIFTLLFKYVPFMSSFRMAGRFALPMICFMTALAAVGAQNLGDLFERHGHCRISRLVLGGILIAACFDLGYVNYKVQGYLPDSWKETPAVLKNLPERRRVYSPYSLLAFRAYEYYLESNSPLSKIDYRDAYWQHKSLLSSGISNIFGVETPDDYLNDCGGVVSYYAFAVQKGITGIMNDCLSCKGEQLQKLAFGIDNWLRIQDVSHIITPMPLPKDWPQSEFERVYSFPIPEIPESRVHIYTLANQVKKIRLVPVLQTDAPANCIDLERYLQIHTGSLYEPDFARPADIGRVVVEKETNNTITLATSCDRDAHLVMSVSYDPNWQAAVDGEPVSVRLTNLAMQSLPVPKGEHRVELRYVSPAFERGRRISLFSLIAFILLGVWAAFRRGAPQAAKQSASTEPEG